MSDEVSTGTGEVEEAALRPTRLAEFGGQPHLVEELRITLTSAARRNKLPHHMLFAGSPGLGKTTLATIVANELGVPLVTTSGPALENGAMLASILSGLSGPTVVFIDEIHAMPRQVEEILYPAMEDWNIDLTLGQGATSRTVRIPIQKFCLIGATTRVGMLTEPLRDRFGYTGRVRLYDNADLTRIVQRTASLLDVDMDADAARIIASRSRGTPRVANVLAGQVRDYAVTYDIEHVDGEAAAAAMDAFGVDPLGLDRVARDLLEALVRTFGGGPVGLTTLAQAIGEDPQTVEYAYEPHLMRSGLMQRTPKGRVATEAAFEHLGVEATAPAQLRLSAFDLMPDATS